MKTFRDMTFDDFAGVDLAGFDATAEDMRESPLMMDFRIKISDIADVLKMSAQAVTYEIKKLEIESQKEKKNAFLTQSQIRKYLNHKGFRFLPQTLNFLMLKGGVGKTTCSVNLAVMLNRLGARVLYMDLDPQGNATSWFCVNTTTRGLPIFINVIKDEASIADCIVNITEGFDLIPSDFDNAPSDFEIQMRKKNYTSLVQKHIQTIKDQYDYIIIDSNPTLSMTNESAALASDLVIIPTMLDSFSKKGLKETLVDLWRISKEAEKLIRFKLLLNQEDGRELMAKKYKRFFSESFPERIFATSIRTNSDIRKTTDEKKSIFDKKNASSIEDYLGIALELTGLDEFVDSLKNNPITPTNSRSLEQQLQ
jgi:chromosome partitioning protein